MIRPSPDASLARPTNPYRSPRSAPTPSGYGRPFWLTYAANFLLMVAVSLLFRYADLVTCMGGNEWHLGWIVGIGMVGSLAMRLTLGTSIDHYGPRAVWRASIVLFAASCFAHLAVTSHTGPVIYALRILFCCTIAGVFGASMTFVAGRVSIVRMTEMIGILGTAGFLGMIVGPRLGDLLAGPGDLERWHVDRMFFAAGLLGCGSAVFVWLATRGHRPPVRIQRPPLWRLLQQYHPGKVFLVGVAMGVGLGMPGTFLRTYSEQLGVGAIGPFFAVYAVTAIVARILTRRLPERIGTTPMILAGLALLSASQLVLVVVASPWMLAGSGAGFGLSHAALFPSVVAAGSRAFPVEHRGLGTTLILSTWDVGQLVGAPAAGAVLKYSALFGLPPYPTLFVSLSAMLGVVGAYFALSHRRPAEVQQTSTNHHQARRKTVIEERTPVAEMGVGR